jgi:hypothetical protein
MIDRLKISTREHINSSARMPRKGIAKVSKRWRKAIADYYRAKKKENPKMARLNHRHSPVTDPSDARKRLKNMS